MKKEIEIKVIPEKKDDQEFIKSRLAKKLHLSHNRIVEYNLLKRSIDARGRTPLYVLRYEVYVDDVEGQKESNSSTQVSNKLELKEKVIIVGAGPAGYFAALECIQLGLAPIVLERGKDVQQRRRDLRAIQQEGIVNPDSNYCFGEGGAGTYSDGKLYTRSHKRGNIQNILEILVAHGAKEDILVDAHPHIGSNKLPQIVQKLRDTIESNGGEIHFGTKVVDFIIKNQKIIGVQSEKGEYLGEAVILATGHSARDIFDICEKHQLGLEFKPYAIGVRIEHPQPLIDEIQYNRRERGAHLPAASYRLACQYNGVGVFSFCMCPGGLIVPASTAPGELVVNGMSLSRRDSAFANAGTVITVDETNIPDFKDKFSGLRFQQELEHRFFDKGDGTQQAPAQRLTDFVRGKVSKTLGDSSYIPGTYSADFSELLPGFIYDSLAEAVRMFDRKLKGYYTSEAHVIGLESRTSSPLKLPRDRSSYMHNGVSGLFPCGEGAGYAGGILSAAMDGQNVAKAIKRWLTE